MTTDQALDLAAKIGVPAVLLAAVLFGLYKLADKFGDRFLTRWEATLDKFEVKFSAIQTEQAAHELRDVERHGKVLEAIKGSESQTSSALQELSTHVEVGLAEQRGRREAEDVASERPTRPIPVVKAVTP